MRNTGLNESLWLMLRAESCCRGQMDSLLCVPSNPWQGVGSSLSTYSSSLLEARNSAVYRLPNFHSFQGLVFSSLLPPILLSSPSTCSGCWMISCALTSLGTTLSRSLPNLCILLRPLLSLGLRCPSLS